MGARDALDQNVRSRFRDFKTSVGDPMNISLCGNDTDNPRDGKELPGPFLLLPSRIRAVL